MLSEHLQKLACATRVAEVARRSVHLSAIAACHPLYPWHTAVIAPRRTVLGCLVAHGADHPWQAFRDACVYRRNGNTDTQQVRTSQFNRKLWCPLRINVPRLAILGVGGGNIARVLLREDLCLPRQVNPFYLAGRFFSDNRVVQRGRHFRLCFRKGYAAAHNLGKPLGKKGTIVWVGVT